MVENSVQIARKRPRGPVGSLIRWLVFGGLFSAALFLVLPHGWLAWRRLPARSLEPGASETEVREALGPVDVRLPLDPSDPFSEGSAECWIWFWPEDPLRKICKRLPFAPDHTAFDLEERSSAMVRAFFDDAETLHMIEIE